ncbi:MAG: ABC transporter ATP-binding protein [Sulfolobaceae archaeon]
MIEVSHVFKYFGDKVVNEDINFSFNQGILVILGPNGAGKTTLLRQIYGDLKPDKGEVLIDGFRPNDRKAKRLLGVMPQDSEPIFNLTVYDHIKLFAKIRNVEDAENKAKELIREFDLNPKERVNKLSGGQKRRVMLASILILDPKYLILDEPTVGLDLDSRKLIHEMLKDLGRRGKGIILTTHYLDEAEKLADRVILLNKRILFDGPKEDLIKKVFNEDIYVVKIRDEKYFVKKDEINKFFFSDKNNIEIRKPTLEELYYEFFRKNK